MAQARCRSRRSTRGRARPRSTWVLRGCRSLQCRVACETIATCPHVSAEERLMLKERFDLGCRVLDEKIKCDTASGNVAESEQSMTELPQKMQGTFKVKEGQEDANLPDPQERGCALRP
eukprot:2940050-Pyramimonas_sp.AAC.1